MQFLPNVEEIKNLRFQYVLLQNKDGNRPPHRPFFPFSYHALNYWERELEEIFLFHSDTYSLQQSSEIQNISVTLFSVAIAICVYLYVNTLMLQ